MWLLGVDDGTGLARYSAGLPGGMTGVCVAPFDGITGAAPPRLIASE